ncbi:glycolipid translocation protein [Ascoidea rubescens DSM 1968]|uniref:Man(5)GlcNAc(2)-PP-dolichol translocation protein RFT1 n=1 Tax=Ascoidea rubescens DSM 1968 TaxID=1344418 RepID=A0A1D2VAL0_9ASCO|nr:Rft-1-domain-containing protein [Ascoidea rubescens DSM 1968]ODV58708.1 Rft-1-domain-containing protein [Ascoidea rubescens DSM 1968]
MISNINKSNSNVNSNVNINYHNNKDSCLTPLPTNALSNLIKYTIFSNVFFKVINFTFNQFILKLITPTSLGFNVYLEFLIKSILFFSREAIRISIQRINNNTSSNTINNTNTNTNNSTTTTTHDITNVKSSYNNRNNKNNKKIYFGTEFATYQSIINLSYIPLFIGLFLTLIILIWQSNKLYLYLNFDLTFFILLIILIFTSSILELLSEPFYNLNQFKLNFKIKSKFESTSLTLNCLVNYILIYYFKFYYLPNDLLNDKNNNSNNGEFQKYVVLSFVLGKFVYSLSIYSLYFFNYKLSFTKNYNYIQYTYNLKNINVNNNSPNYNRSIKFPSLFLTRIYKLNSKLIDSYPSMYSISSYSSKNTTKKQKLNKKNSNPNLNLNNSLNNKLYSESFYYLDPVVFNHWKSVFSQFCFKHFLTEGDTFIINSFCSLNDQGIYSLILNYGSLLTRFIYLPIEESLRIYLTKLLKSNINTSNNDIIKTVNTNKTHDIINGINKKSLDLDIDSGTETDIETDTDTDTEMPMPIDSDLDPNLNLINKNLNKNDEPIVPLDNLKESWRLLIILLKFYYYLSFIIIIFGYFNSFFLLKLILSGNNSNKDDSNSWLNSSISKAMPIYCLYLPFLSINGIFEAFFQSTANSKKINYYSYFLLLSSILYLVFAYFLVVILDFKLVGLILANIFNMSLRILFCSIFILNFFQNHLKYYNLNLSKLNIVFKRFSANSITSISHDNNTNKSLREKQSNHNNFNYSHSNSHVHQNSNSMHLIGSITEESIENYYTDEKNHLNENSLENFKSSSTSVPSTPSNLEFTRKIHSPRKKNRFIRTDNHTSKLNLNMRNSFKIETKNKINNSYSNNDVIYDPDSLVVKSYKIINNFKKFSLFTFMIFLIQYKILSFTENFRNLFKSGFLGLIYLLIILLNEKDILFLCVDNKKFNKVFFENKFIKIFTNVKNKFKTKWNKAKIDNNKKNDDSNKRSTIRKSYQKKRKNSNLIL